MNAQLPLGIRLRPDSTIESYVPGPNAEALASLREPRGRSIYLWGGPGSGRSHLLQAVCHQAAGRGESAFYLPLAQAREFTPDILDGLETLGLVCIDDVQAIAGSDEWEHQLFHLYNRVREASAGIVLSGDRPVRELGLRLPDLSTRLSWDLVFQLRPLDDQALTQALCLRARALGMELGEEVATYMMHRCVRDVIVLFDLLERLDRASLAARRRLTIPFVRELIEGRDA